MSSDASSASPTPSSPASVHSMRTFDRTRYSRVLLVTGPGAAGLTIRRYPLDPLAEPEETALSWEELAGLLAPAMQSLAAQLRAMAQQVRELTREMAKWVETG